MAENEKSIRDQVLEELVEAGALYLNLGEYIHAHDLAKLPRGKNRENIIEPSLDMIILRADIWKRIRELAQKLPFI